MENFTLDHDIKVLTVTAKSFPEGVMDAFNKVKALGDFSKDRNTFGLSRPENGGGIIYKAGVEEKNESEGEKYGCETIVIKKGEYISETIKDFMKNISSIGQTFQEMIKRPDIDPEGYCVEWYSTDSKDVRCMVRLRS